MWAKFGTVPEWKTGSEERDATDRLMDDEMMRQHAPELVVAQAHKRREGRQLRRRRR